MKKVSLLFLILILSLYHGGCANISFKENKIPKPEDQVYFSQGNRSSQWIDIIIQTDKSSDPEKYLQVISESIPFKQRHIYRKAYYGAAISIRFYHIPALLDYPFIEKIFFCQESYFPVRDRASVSVEANHVWTQVDDNSNFITGQGIKVGMVDTGIDPYHKEFTPTGIGPDSKIQVAKNMVDPNDPMEDLSIYPHGTHVGGIIAGKNPDNQEKKGIAHDSNLYVFRVFSKQGTLQLPDILAGIEEAILNKVDVLNISLGFSSKNPIPSIAEGDPFYEAIQSGIKNGIVICSAAGNSGARNVDNPWPLLAPGLFDQVIQPSASDDRMSQLVTIEWNKQVICSINATPSLHIPPFTEEMSNTPVIDCGYGSSGEFERTTVNGKIALISRGPKENPIPLSEKNLQAKKAGAIGCIIYNFEDSVMNSALANFNPENESKDQEFIPNLTISGFFAKKLKNYLSIGGQLVFRKPTTAVIADFTSVGPCGSVDQNIFKPDICFPGKQINSSIQTIIDKDNNRLYPYEDWDGTSMSTAGTSGCIALIKQAHPNWTPEDIKAACMNNADLLINPFNNEVFPFFAQGAGQLNINRSLNTPVIIEPPSFMQSIKEQDNAVVSLALKNQTKENIHCDFSIGFFHLPNYTSLFKLQAKEPSIDIQPFNTSAISLQIQFEKHTLSENKYEGVIWVTVHNQQTENKPFKLHIPIILYQNTLSEIPPVIEPISMEPERMVPGTPFLFSFRLNAGSMQEFYQNPIYLNHAQQIRIIAEDRLHNVYEELFYGENLFIGQYELQWDGLDRDGKVQIPNGLYYLTAEISGLKIVNKSIENTIHTYPLGSFRITQSPLPEIPLLILSSVSKVSLGEPLAVDLLLLNAEHASKIDLEITFSKSSVSPISYILNEQIDANFKEPDSLIAFEKGNISLKTSFKQAIPNKIKLGTFLFKTERATNQKDGIYLKIDKFILTDINQKGLIGNVSYPLIVVEKEKVKLGDFNHDKIVNPADYNLLMAHLQENYLSEYWISEFDLNNDLQIDILDFIIFSKFFSDTDNILFLRWEHSPV